MPAQFPYYFDDAHLRLADDLEGFAERHLARRAWPESAAEADADARKLVRLIGEAGLTRHVVPGEYGGVTAKIGIRALCLIRERLASANPLADTMFAMQGLGSFPIGLAGTKEQRQRWLPAIARGEAIAAFALTEPDAGSDVKSLSTVAFPDGTEYVLEGTKHLISNAGLADIYVLFASTDPDLGAQGHLAFLLPADTPGLTITPQETAAPHPLGKIELDGVRLRAPDRLGSQGEGLTIALATLNRFRPTVGAAACGMARRALDEAITWVRRRRVFGERLSSFQLTQAKLADMATSLRAARLLVYHAAWTLDMHAERAELEGSMAKLFATESAFRIVDDAVQLHGGAGVLRGTPVEHLARDVRSLRIYEGTSEIQRLVIARELLRQSQRHDPTTEVHRRSS